MVSFITEGLSDELASWPVKLSAAEPQLSRGHAQIQGGNRGRSGRGRPTHRPDCCHPQPAGMNSFTSPLKVANKGCEGCRMVPVPQ